MMENRLKSKAFGDPSDKVMSLELFPKTESTVITCLNF
jgi:hypothetical protein